MEDSSVVELEKSTMSSAKRRFALEDAMRQLGWDEEHDWEDSTDIRGINIDGKIKIRDEAESPKRRKSWPFFKPVFTFIHSDLDYFVLKYFQDFYDWTELCQRRPVDWRSKFRAAKTFAEENDNLCRKLTVLTYMTITRGNRLDFWPVIEEKWKDKKLNSVIPDLIRSYPLTAVGSEDVYGTTVLEFQRVHGFRVVAQFRCADYNKLEQSWLLTSHGLLTAISVLEKSAAMKFLTLHLVALRNATHGYYATLSDENEAKYAAERDRQDEMCERATRTGLFYKNLLETAIELAESFEMLEPLMARFAWEPSIFVKWHENGYFEGTPELDELWNSREVEDLQDPLADRLVEIYADRLPQYPMITNPSAQVGQLGEIVGCRVEQRKAFQRRSGIKKMLALDGEELIEQTKVYEDEFDDFQFEMELDELEEEWISNIRDKSEKKMSIHVMAIQHRALFEIMMRLQDKVLDESQRKSWSDITSVFAFIHSDLNSFLDFYFQDVYDWTEFCQKRAAVDWKRKFHEAKLFMDENDDMNRKLTVLTYLTITRRNRLDFWPVRENDDDDKKLNSIIPDLIRSYHLVSVDSGDVDGTTVLQFQRVHGFRLIGQLRCASPKKLEHSWLLTSHGLLTAISVLEKSAALKLLTLHMVALKNDTTNFYATLSEEDEEKYESERDRQEEMCERATRTGLFYKNILETAIELAESFEVLEPMMVRFAWDPSIFVKWHKKGYYKGTPELDELWNTREVEELHDPLAERLVEVYADRLPRYPLITNRGTPSGNLGEMIGSKPEQLKAFHRRSGIKKMLALDGEELIEQTKVYEDEFDDFKTEIELDDDEEQWYWDIREKKSRPIKSPQTKKLDS
ncbi:unnamed protein product [Caenorhabditis auriculariae]|uniref:Uncharacterized protein n=1 Tax=Caenorhabditis auriculariae TaxID=2777116 RepID=A0A8S1HJW2_9PELO|nr:unnamed protein product [Caenorhabditis auriculariae]